MPLLLSLVIAWRLLIWPALATANRPLFSMAETYMPIPNRVTGNFNRAAVGTTSVILSLRQILLSLSEKRLSGLNNDSPTNVTRLCRILEAKSGNAYAPKGVKFAFMMPISLRYWAKTLKPFTQPAAILAVVTGAGHIIYLFIFIIFGKTNTLTGYLAGGL
jgi:hypothetical protein